MTKKKTGDLTLNNNDILAGCRSNTTFNLCVANACQTTSLVVLFMMCTSNYKCDCNLLLKD